MQNGHLIWEWNGQRFLALPRDHREGYKCYHCCFAFTPHARRVCPADKDGNRLCEFGHGFTFKRLPNRPTPVLEIADDKPVQMLLITEEQKQ